MARKPRIHIPGGFYHVILRAQPDIKLFLAKEDGKYFYELLADGIRRYQYRVHGFCLVKDNIQLLIEIDQVPLVNIMHNISFRYARWMQKRHAHQGQVFYDRYRAKIFDPEHYLLKLLRRIHLIPVYANTVTSPHLYLWSSHRAYLGQTNSHWLTTNRALSQLSDDMNTARDILQDFIFSSMKHNLNEIPLRRNILGNTQFQQKIRDHFRSYKTPDVSMSNIIDTVCNHYQINESELASPGKNHARSKVRGILALLIRDLSSASLSDLGRIMNRDVTTLSALAKRIHDQSQQDAQLANTIDTLKHSLLKKAALTHRTVIPTKMEI